MHREIYNLRNANISMEKKKVYGDLNFNKDIVYFLVHCETQVLFASKGISIELS